MKPPSASVKCWILERRAYSSTWGIDVREWSAMEAFRESEGFWWVLLMISFQKNRNTGLKGGADHIRDANNTSDSLKASMFASPATTEAFNESEMLWWVLQA